MTEKLIIWDYNGTLIDDVYVALNSVNDMLIKRNMQTITIEQYYTFMDTPITKFYENLFDLNEITFDIIAKEFHKGYKKHLPVNPLMENAIKVLEFAHKMNYKQVLISSSNIDKIIPTLKEFSILKYFDDISGATNNYADCKIQRGRSLIKKYSIKKENIYIIGDTLHDYEFAKEIDVKCILTSKGHDGINKLKNSNAIVIDDLMEVIEIIK